MKRLPEYLIPNLDNKEDYYLDICMELLRKSITNYILTEDLSLKFYNLSDFYLINKIDNNTIKSRLKDQIIVELKDFGWSTATLFNKTGIVICNSTEEMSKNVWKSTLDFEIV